MSDTDTAGDIAKIEAAAAADPSVAASVALAGGAAVVAAAMTDGAAAAPGPANAASADADSAAAEPAPKAFETSALSWEHPFDYLPTRRAKSLELAINSLPEGGYYEASHIVARAAEFEAYITGAAAD